ncbi:hypothetical protein J3F83DRAFT_210864 [Trichoderma novae-zelandiae]
MFICPWFDALCTALGPSYRNVLIDEAERREGGRMRQPHGGCSAVLRHATLPVCSRRRVTGHEFTGKIGPQSGVDATSKWDEACPPRGLGGGRRKGRRAGPCLGLLRKAPSHEDSLTGRLSGMMIWWRRPCSISYLD